MGLKLFFSILIFLLLVGITFMALGVADDTIIVEADVKASDSFTAIEVDKNYINFGIVSKTIARYDTININNTGSEDVNITFELQNYSGKIFEYIYVRKSPGSPSDYLPIKQFSVVVNSDDGNGQDLRFILNLSKYPSPIYQDAHLIANITIKAMPLGAFVN